MEKKLQMTKAQISEYYENHFKPVEFAKLVGLSDFDQREIAWLDYPGGDKDFHRNTRFDSLKDFISWVSRQSPFKLYFGAVFDRKWGDVVPKIPWKQWAGTIQKVPWRHNLLHFDIDANDSDLMRRGGICSCGNAKQKKDRKKICNDCFQIVKEAAFFLMDTLNDDFGISNKNVNIFFSGTRGLHVHYPDVKLIGEDENDDKIIRKNLVEYLSAVKEVEVDDSKIVDGVTIEETKIVPRIASKIPAITLKNRIDATVYKWFFTRSPEETIKKARVTPLALKVIKEMFQDGKNMGDIMMEIVKRDLLTKQRIESLREAAMIYRYPRYDGSATYDVRKVMKVPRSIDCSTGFIVSRIDDLDCFELADVDHVNNYVKME